MVPRCKTGQDDHLYLEHGGTWVDGEWVENDDIYVESSIAAEFPVQKIEVLDCAYSVGEKYTPAGSSTQIERTEASCREEMLKDAQKRFTEDHCDGIYITLSVDFVLMGDTEQYRQYKGLQNVNLYDMIPIKTRTYETEAEVTAYKFDSLRNRYISIDVGNISSFQRRVPGFRVVNESITYAKLAPEIISMIRNAGTTGDTTGASGGTPTGGLAVETEVIDNLTSTSTSAALSANQGKNLNDKIGAMIPSKTLSKTGASQSINIPSGFRGVIVGTTSNTSACFAIIIISYSNGSVYVADLYKGTSVTFNTGTANTLGIALDISRTMDYLIFAMTKNSLDSVT